MHKKRRMTIQVGEKSDFTCAFEGILSSCKLRFESPSTDDDFSTVPRIKRTKTSECWNWRVSNKGNSLALPYRNTTPWKRTSPAFSQEIYCYTEVEIIPLEPRTTNEVKVPDTVPRIRATPNLDSQRLTIVYFSEQLEIVHGWLHLLLRDPSVVSKVETVRQVWSICMENPLLSVFKSGIVLPGQRLQ